MDFYVFLFSFISGMLCSMGFGGGTALIVFLTAMLSYEQTAAQGINLMFFIPSAILSLIIYRKEKLTDKSRIIPLALGGVAGVAAGYFLLSRIPTLYLSKLFGAFVIFTGIKGLLSTRKQTR